MWISEHWKIVGFLGTALFAGRWVVQVWASRRAGRSVTSAAFWICSLLGSLLLLVYFGLGPRRDSVGLAGNCFPFAVALYNLFLSRRAHTCAAKGQA
jgi:lipid-A-disaccharide synthase-like uncharacterized protein